MATPSDDIIISVSADRRKGIIVKTQLQGMLLAAIEDMARDRREDIGQVIKDIIEQRLVKDGYLPEWWFIRGKGIR